MTNMYLRNPMLLQVSTDFFTEFTSTVYYEIIEMSTHFFEMTEIFIYNFEIL